MTIQEEIPQQNPFEDQRKQALELYEKMVKECHHCSSFIQRAIESHNPDLKAQLSAKEQECEELKKHFEKEKEEMVISSNKLATKVADQLDELSYLRAERDELKKALGGGMYSEQKKVIAVLDNEITLLRAENDRLKKALDAMDKRRVEIGGERNELRKRCEDLEAVLTYFVEKFKNDYPGSTIALMAERGSKLLNQIKS